MPTGLFDDLVEQPVSKTGLFDDLVSTPNEKGYERNPDTSAVPFHERVLRSEATGHVLHSLSRLRPDIMFRDALVMLGQPQKILGYSGGVEAPSPIDQPLVSSETVKNAMEMMVPRGSTPNPATEGLQNFVSQVVSGMSTVPNVAGLVGGKISPAIPAIEFIPPMVQDLPQAIQDVGTSQTPQERTANLLRVMLNIVGPLGMGGAFGEKVSSPSGLKYNEIPGPKMEDLPGGQEIAPASRQLGYSATPFPGPRERGLLLPENTYNPASEVSPVGGASFVTDPAARTLPVEQLSPLELREAMRGPREFSLREESVRPAQQAPVILGQQPAQARPVYYTGLFQDLVEPVVPSKAPVEPSGGKVSFRSEASAEGIPNARQRALPQSQVTIPPEIVNQAFQGPAVPQRVPYRAPKNPPTQEEYLRQQQRASVEQGLNQPSGYYTGDEPLPYAKEAQYPPEGPPQGTLSALQRSRIQAGKKNIRSNVSKNPPLEGKENASTIRSPEVEVQKSGNVGQGLENQSGDSLQQLREKEQPAESTGVSQEARGEVKPEVVKLGGSKIKGPLGDPLGTTYRATPEDYAAYQKAQADLKQLTVDDPHMEKPDSMARYQEIVGRNEVIKNKYGGMPPEAPLSGSIPSEAKGRLYGGIPFLDPALLKDTAKNVKEVGAKLGEYFKGAADKVLPALNFDTKSPLPDYQPKDIANKIFSQPFASEKMPVLGRLMGGKARIRTPQDEAVATWYAERHGVGPAIASHLGEQIRGRIDKVFEVDEKGNLNVKPTEGPGQSLKISDVFEGLRKNPTAYRLTPAQSQVFNTVIEPVTKRMSELARKYDLIDEMVDESGDFKPYFPRIVTKHPKIEDKGPTSAFKKRAFSTEKEGWDRGYEYETSAEKRLVSGVERLYRAIANQRLATDPILGAKSEAQVKADIAESFREELGSGAMTQAKIDRIAEGIRTRGQVMQPILIRKIFDPETAKMLNREFAAEQSRIIKSVASANSFLKATQLGFDLGVGQIQMLPMLYNNPKVWAQSQFKSLQSMASPKFFSEYMQQPENVKAGSELAQMGSSVGRMQEMMSGVGEGQLITKIPVVGDVAQAFGRQFQTALDVAKVELWKALRETAPKSEWPKLVRGIETSLLSGRQESAMVPHGRALLERVALLAPSYYRGAVDSIAGLAEQGASGKVIRNTMGRFVLGGLITYYAVAKMVGMDDKQIKERLDPTRSDYLNWAIKQDDGSVVNVGYGGVHRSMLRLLANSVKTSVEHPENWKSLSSEKNPLSRWLRGHSAPIPSAGWDAVTGEDFLGRESNVKTIAQGRLPLIAQQAITKPGEAPAKPIEYGASFAGMTAVPENFSSRRGREVDQAAKERFGKSFEELSIGQRLNVERTVEKKLAGVPRGMTETKTREIAQSLADQRLEKVKSKLNPEAAKWVEDSGVKIRNYETSKEIAGTSVHFTKPELEVLQKNITEEYEKAIDTLRNNQRINGLPLSDKQRYVDVHLEVARKKAWAKTIREVRQGQK